MVTNLGLQVLRYVANMRMRGMQSGAFAMMALDPLMVYVSSGPALVTTAGYVLVTTGLPTTNVVRACPALSLTLPSAASSV
jgi:hypothetical protein